MSRPFEGFAEAGVETRKMPQDNPEVWQGIRELIDDPVTYLAKEREASLRDAREHVDEQVSRRLAEDHLSIGRRLVVRLVSIFAEGRDSPRHQHG